MNMPTGERWGLEEVFSAETLRTPARRLMAIKDILFGLSLVLGCLALVCILLAVLSAAYA